MTGELFIEFDSQLVQVRSDVPRVLEYVGETYELMLSNGGVAPTRSLSVWRTSDGYKVVGTETASFPWHDVEPLLPFIKEEIRLEFIRSRPDLLWIHAGAVERDGCALIISGKSGNGKSTLVTHMCGYGWRLMSDDTVPIIVGARAVRPFLQLPVRRIDPGRSLSPVAVKILSKEAVRMTDANLCRATAKISAVVFLSYQRESPVRLERMPMGSAAMALLDNTTNFSDHRAAAVQEAAALARGLPIYSLSYGSAPSAAGILDSLPTGCERNSN